VKRGRERKLEAYRDGALSAVERKRVEHDLQKDVEGARYLERSIALGSLIRESWSEGPEAPSAERLLASIAPELRRFDAERAQRGGFRRLADRWTSGVRDALDSFVRPWATAAGTVAVVAVAVFALMPRGVDPDAGRVQTALSFIAPPPVPGGSVPMLLASDGANFDGELSWPSAVYDLAQEDIPLMVSEKNGAIVIMLGEPAPPPSDDISGVTSREGWA
jgi:hypothetical protein